MIKMSSNKIEAKIGKIKNFKIIQTYKNKIYKTL